MNAAQYLLDRMRTCKALHEIGDKKARGCFQSVGSATHSFHGDDAVGFGQATWWWRTACPAP